jgi:hypothetical protein
VNWREGGDGFGGERRQREERDNAKKAAALPVQANGPGIDRNTPRPRPESEMRILPLAIAVIGPLWASMASKPSIRDIFFLPHAHFLHTQRPRARP